jgi:uncharacterized RDD family membrane protein YckC
MIRNENEVYYPYVKATPQHRLAAVAVDAGFSIVTCFVGYLIWTIITWGNGQTPGKQLLKIRVYSSTTGRPATWGNMAIRQFLIPFALSMIFYIPYLFTTLLGSFNDSLYYISIAFLVLSYIAFFALHIVDACWIFKDGQFRRFTDKLAKTDVLNEC